MATTTRTNMRKALSEVTGDHLSFATSAAGASSNDSLIANILKNQVNGTDTDGFEFRHFLSVSGDNSGESRVCKSYAPLAADGATVIVQSPYSNTTASGDTFELHRIDPEIKHVALNLALVELNRLLYLPKRDETLIVDSILSNGDFETFTTTNVPDDWTSVNSPTLTEENTIVFLSLIHI